MTDPLNLSGNYGVGGVLRLNRNQYDTKVNYNLTQTLRMGKYSRMDAPVEGKYPFGDLGGSAGWAPRARVKPPRRSSPAASTHVISPTFIFDGVFGYTRMDQFVGIPNRR